MEECIYKNNNNNSNISNDLHMMAMMPVNLQTANIILNRVQKITNGKLCEIANINSPTQVTICTYK